MGERKLLNHTQVRWKSMKKLILIQIVVCRRVSMKFIIIDGRSCDWLDCYYTLMVGPAHVSTNEKMNVKKRVLLTYLYIRYMHIMVQNQLSNFAKECVCNYV